MHKRPGSAFYLMLVLLFTNINSTMAQFYFDRIDDQAAFEFQEPIEFFAHPRFNRVEGFFAHAGVALVPRNIEGFSSKIEAGWGFWNESGKELRFKAGARKDFSGFDRLSIGIDVFRELGTKDDWSIRRDENSLFAFWFREDYRDYYGAHGAQLYVDKQFAGNHIVRMELARRTYDTLKRNINWSVFGGNFQNNPSVALMDSSSAEGDELGIRLIAAFDWRDNRVFPIDGWYVEAIYERTADDFDTDGLFLRANRYQQAFGNQRLVLRAMLGTRSGSLAPQHTIDLGGIGSLRGYSDKEFSGNRMLMLNANYTFGGDILQKIPAYNLPIIGTLWTTLSLGTFFDTGWIGFADPNQSFLAGFSDISFKSNIGLSLIVLDGVFRIDFARRLNGAPAQDDFRFTFRLLEIL